MNSLEEYLAVGFAVGLLIGAVVLAIAIYYE